MKRVHLWEPGTGKQSIDVIRSAAVALATFAVDGARGRAVGDPVHEWVTEGRRAANEARRARGSKEVPYSSCGDLAHWLLACLGCRDERVVNRTDDGGVVDWRVSVNLSRLRYSPWWIDASAGTPAPGDVLLVSDREDGKDGHVAVLTRIVDPTQWVTADYGQPYGAQRVCVVERGRVRGRRLRGFVSLARVPFAEPAIVPDGFDGGVCDDNPYRDTLRVPEGV